MTVAADGREGPRERALDEVDRLRLKVTTLGAVAAELVQTQGDNATTLLDGVLDPGSSPADALRGVTAFWVETMRAQVDFWRDLCSTLREPPPDPNLGLGGVFGRELRFAIPKDAQATDPVVLEAPAAEPRIDFVEHEDPGKRIPRHNIYVSLSSDRKALQVALVDLQSVEGLRQPGWECSAGLYINGVPFKIRAIRLP